MTSRQLPYPYVFLSYSRIEEPFAKRLEQDLQAHGIWVWRDETNINPGSSDWEAAVRDAIRHAYAVVLIASPSVIKSLYIKGELNLAKRYHPTSIYPIWIDGTDWSDCVPIDFINTQYIDMRREKYGTGMNTLINALKRAEASSIQKPVVDHRTLPSYGAQYASPPDSLVPPVQQPPTSRKGPGVGLFIVIVVLVLLLVGGGFLAIHAATRGSNTNTVTPTTTTAPSTPTTSITQSPVVTPTTPTTSITQSPVVIPTTRGTSPSGAIVDPTAAAIITKAQTASAIDSNYYPTQVTSKFKAGQNVYVTFNLTTNGQSGYVEAKLYSDTTYIGNKILTVQSSYDHGYFTVTLNQPSTGTAELYWCTKSDCSDAKLATFVTFNVS